jgi:hypothetical protein
MNARLTRLGLVSAMVAAGAALALGGIRTERPGPGRAPAGKYSHNARYTELSGQLIWRPIEGGHWQIQYIDPTDAGLLRDSYRGRFTLGTPPRLEGFKDREWVKVTGRPRPNMATIWMTGTYYELKSVKRLGPLPKPVKLDPETQKLVTQAEKMREAKQRFPGEFKPARDLRVRWDGKRRQLLFLLTNRKGSVFSPRIIENAITARRAVEEHIRADTGNYVHSFRHRGQLLEDEKIARNFTGDFYHRFDTTFQTKDEQVYHMVYIVLRPVFLAEASGRPNAWRTAGGKGLKMGRRALSNPANFAAAADLLVYLMLKDGNGYLLSRGVEKVGPVFRFSATLADYIRSPASRTDWRFEPLVIEVHSKTGRVHIGKAPVARAPTTQPDEMESPATQPAE